MNPGSQSDGEFVVLYSGHTEEEEEETSSIASSSPQASTIPDIINMTEPIDSKRNKYAQLEYERYVADKAEDNGCNNFLCSDDGGSAKDMAKLFDMISRLLVP